MFSSMQCSVSDIYDGGISLSNNSTACLSPPLDGSEEIPQDLFNNDLVHERDYDNARNWFLAYDDKSPKNFKSDLDKSRKQAMAAKLNREKKKKYISELECHVKTLRDSDKLQREKLEFAKERIENLEREVSYLKAVLAHDSQLSNLLRNIPATPGLQFDSVLHNQFKPRMTPNHAKRKFTSETTIRQVSQAEYNKRCEAADDNTTISCKKFHSSNVQAAPGVCLHVSEERVTIELCSECSRKAANLNQ